MFNAIMQFPPLKFLLKKTKDATRDEQGAAAVIVALSLVAILGCGALAVDLGASYHAKIKLQNAVDNAALAAGTLLPASANKTTRAQVQAKAEDYLAQNGYPAGSADISYSWTANAVCSYRLRITAEEKVNYGFARVLGLNDGTVTATASVTSRTLTYTVHAVNLFLPKTDFENQLYRIMQSASVHIKVNVNKGNGETGNMGQVNAVTTAGDSFVMDISVGDEFPIVGVEDIYNDVRAGLNELIAQCQRECGGNCTKEHHSNTCPRIVLMPVVNTSSGVARVEYFVPAYINSVSKGAKNIQIVAEFLRDYSGTTSSGGAIITDNNPYKVGTPTLEE